MKKLLVAGGTGFIGYHICKFAKKKKFFTVSISKNKPSKKRRVKGVKYIIQDLRSKHELEKLTWDYNFVINCSGYGRLLSNKSKGNIFYQNHLISLKNLVRLSNNKFLKKFIQLGSSTEYGMTKSPQKENIVCKPSNIYGKAKLACTKYLLKIFKNEKFPCVILRLFQVYGPLQQNSKIVPFVIKNSKKNKKFKVTKGNQERDFLYIDDLVLAIFKCMYNKQSNGKIINLGFGSPVRLHYVIEYILSKIRRGKALYGKKINQFKENESLYPDISKAQKILNWSPKIDIYSGINKILAK